MKTRKWPAFLLIPPILCLLAAGLIWQRWQAAGDRGIPEVTVSLNGTKLLQHEGNWQAPVLGRLLTRHLEGNYPAIGITIPVDQPQNVLAVSPEDAMLTRVQLTDQAGQIVVYDGDAAGFSNFVFDMDGDYYLEVWGELDRNTQGFGSFYFDAALEVQLPRPEFALSSSQVHQGDLISVTAKNLPEGVVPINLSVVCAFIDFSDIDENAYRCTHNLIETGIMSVAGRSELL